LVDLEVGQPGADTVSFAVAEPGADLAGEAELVASVDADEEASDLAGQAAIAGMPAADDELLAGPDLDLCAPWLFGLPRSLRQ
jgi:hypothetical protein